MYRLNSTESAQDTFCGITVTGEFRVRTVFRIAEINLCLNNNINMLGTRQASARGIPPEMHEVAKIGYLTSKCISDTEATT